MKNNSTKETRDWYVDNKPAPWLEAVIASVNANLAEEDMQGLNPGYVYHPAEEARERLEAFHVSNRLYSKAVKAYFGETF